MGRGTSEMQVRSFSCRLCHGDGGSDRGGDIAAVRSRQCVSPCCCSSTGKQANQIKILSSNGRRFLDNKEEICVFAVVSLARKESTSVTIIIVDHFLAL